jgi:uncharacterized membrane protein
MNRSTRRLINFAYTAFIVIISLFLPISIVMGTLGTSDQIAGIVGALLSFVLLFGYVFYTLILGTRNS